MQKKLTEGNITTKILSFMFPIMIGNGLQRVYTLVDTIMVGRLLGTAQLAAVGSASVVANLFIDLCASFTTGFAIVVAQFFGANDERKMKKSIAGTYLLGGCIAVFLMATGFLLLNPILHWTKVPDEIMFMAKQYLHIMLGGLIFTLVYNMMANVLRALGDSTVPLIFLIISVCLNMILDYVSIAVLGWGVAGVAGATILSQAIAGSSCVIFCLFKRKIVLVKKEDFVFDGKIFKMIISQGIAMALMLSVVSLSTLILQTGINSLGTVMIAGYMAGRKYLEIFMIPGMAISMTAANFVSQNFGAREYNRIKTGVNQMMLMAFLWAAISFVVIFAFGRQIIISVTGQSAAEEVILCGIRYLRIGVIFFIPLDLLVISRSSLQGMNHRKTPVFSSCIELIVKIIAVLLFVPFFGFLGICITEPLIWCVNAVWIYPVYRRRIKELMDLNNNN
ncbi:MAG: MATE family efflux transporter [Treponema sp.]|nr:MATE family efflux transporter [Treponema sp.]